MKDFIEELKHNQEINIKKGLENRVDIDYVIERLENIASSIYDNGSLLLGNIKDVMKEFERAFKENKEENCKDILDELKTLEEEDNAYIVLINYGHPMGYTIDYWTKDDLSDDNYD